MRPHGNVRHHHGFWKSKFNAQNLRVKFIAVWACPQKTNNQYRLKTHCRPDQINTTLTPVVIVPAGDSPAVPPSSITVTCGPKIGVSNCLAIICGNSSERNSIDDRPVQPLELQMANVEIMEISMARNTDAKSSTVKPVWSSVILSSSDVV